MLGDQPFLSPPILISSSSADTVPALPRVPIGTLTLLPLTHSRTDDTNAPDLFECSSWVLVFLYLPTRFRKKCDGMRHVCNKIARLFCNY